ncbi:MAG: glycosyltransferase family 4 protein, partial [Deltaproteobacteria bacterium]|nr:glycosyltransferase family 4 protein [Deltaproteobacteria bacterium]
FPPERAQVIRSGIDIAHFQHSAVSRKTMRQRLDMAEDDRLVTMIACLKPQKAPLDFVRACARIYQRVPSARFLLVGDGHLRNSVEAEVRRQGLEGCFGLTGWRSDIAEILHASDVCVLTSLWEGLPRVIPQAMAAGVPVVATRVDGSPEAVREGLSGFLVQPGNVAEIAERTIQVLLDPEKAAAMGREGQKSVAEFDVNTMVRNQERLYAALLKDGCQ